MPPNLSPGSKLISTSTLTGAQASGGPANVSGSTGSSRAYPKGKGVGITANDLNPMVKDGDGDEGGKYAIGGV